MNLDSLFVNLRCRIKRQYFKLIYRRCLIIGKDVSFRRRFSLNINDNGTALVSLGDGCFFNNDCSINCRQRVEIGENVLLGEGVRIYDHNHMFSNPTLPIKAQGFSCKPVIIGDDCWIGSNVVILAGAAIGEGSVVGAGTIVSGSVPPNSVVIDRQKLVYRPREGDKWVEL